jgi:type I restriction enzyme R subunit
MADRMFRGKYQSDFAVQVTSEVADAQQFTTQFTNNNLLGSGNFLPEYKTSKARVCVTVGMMTTGYDCPDLLNLGLFRPIFSPTEFIQMKGRGTRRHDFLEEMRDERRRAELGPQPKDGFKLFDFFANCAYFEEGYNYDEVIALPQVAGEKKEPSIGPGPAPVGIYEHLGADILATIKEERVGAYGMKVDRMFFEHFAESVRDDHEVAEHVEAGQWDYVESYVKREFFDKPNSEYTLDKLRRAADVDRRLSLREILEKAFGLIPRFKSKDELLEEEFTKFLAEHRPEQPEIIPALKTYFKAYVTSDQIRHIIESRQLTQLTTNPVFSTRDLRAVPDAYRKIIPDYIKDYVSLNQFAA